MPFTPLVLLALVQTAGSTPQPPAPPATEPSVTAPPAATAVDPATLVFPAGSSGLVLVAVKPDRTDDYEAAIAALHAALAGADAEARRIADGWRVFKAADPDGQGNAIYVHAVLAPLADVDYRPSVVMSRLVPTLPADLLVKYRDALAGPVSRLSLTLLADLAAAPAKPK